MEAKCSVTVDARQLERAAFHYRSTCTPLPKFLVLPPVDGGLLRLTDPTDYFSPIHQYRDPPGQLIDKRGVGGYSGKIGFGH